MAETVAAAAALHSQGLISAALLERIGASMVAEGVPPRGHAAAALAEGVISFPEFVRAHLLPEGTAAESALIVARLDACAAHMLQGDLAAYKPAVDSLGAELLRSHPTLAAGSAGWFQDELTTMMDVLVNYYLGTTHWDRIDEMQRANIEQTAVEVTVAAEAANAAMSRSWSTLKRSVWDTAVTNRLSTVREFSTMTDIMKSVEPDAADSSEVSEARRTLREATPPFIVLLGGGMAAGKSTVVHKLKGDWEGSVVIEADQFKMNDVFFRELNKLTGGDNEVAAMVHSNSTTAANQQLIAALTGGRDVVLDGTMTWQPFVVQTIAMIRQVHEYQFRLGPGWIPETKTEQYYIRGERLARPGKAYIIKMVGVTCDTAVAVSRGFRRKMITSRGVPLLPQIRSHRLFSLHFNDYLPLVDEASLYDTTTETLEVARCSVDNGRRAYCTPHCAAMHWNATTALLSLPSFCGCCLSLTIPKCDSLQTQDC